MSQADPDFKFEPHHLTSYIEPLELTSLSSRAGLKKDTSMRIDKIRRIPLLYEDPARPAVLT